MPKKILKRAPRRNGVSRQKLTAKFKLPADAEIDYKNYSLLQKYLNNRGKIVPRRISGISAKNQRLLTSAIKRARFFALLTSGGIQK